MRLRRRFPGRAIVGCVAAAAWMASPNLVPGTPLAVGRERGAVRDFEQAGARLVDLAVPQADVVIYGVPRKDQLGNDIALGDVNADGRTDILAGAQWSSGSGRNIVGRTYLLYGMATWPPVLDLASAGADREFVGAGLEARLGSAVAVGDWDAVTGQDLLMGSVLADQLDQHNGGAVYLMRGGAGKTGRVDFLYDSPDALIVGDSRTGDSDRLGTDMAVGDLNADGHDDVAVSATFRASSTGAVFVWFGPLAPGTTLNLRSQPADWTILGPAENSWFGANILVGDVTGDGIADLLASSLAVSPSMKAALSTDPVDAGAVYLFAGRPGLGGVVDLSSEDADASIVGTAGSKLGVAVAVGTCGCTGQPLALADVAADSSVDLLIGAPMRDRFTGAVFVLPGPIGTGVIELADRPHLRLDGDTAGARLGWNVVTGDLGDGGGTEILVSAPWATVGGLETAGLVLVTSAPLLPSGALTLNVNTASVAVLGPHTGAGSGGCTLALGDTSGDGVSDLLVGLPDAAPLQRNSAGEIFIIHGPLLAPAPTSPPVLTAVATATHEPTPAPTPTTEPTGPPTATVAATNTPIPDVTAMPDETTQLPTVTDPSIDATPTATSGRPRTGWMPMVVRGR